MVHLDPKKNVHVANPFLIRQAENPIDRAARQADVLFAVHTLNLCVFLDKTNKTFQVLERRCQKIDEKIQAAEKDHQEIHKQIQELENGVQKNENNLQIAENHGQEIHKQIQELENGVQKNENNLQIAENHAQKNDKKIQKIEQDGQETDKKLDGLKKDGQEIHKQIHEFEKGEQEARELIEKVERHAREVQERFDETPISNEELNERKKILDQETEEIQAFIKKVEKEIEEDDARREENKRLNEIKAAAQQEENNRKLKEQLRLNEEKIVLKEAEAIQKQEESRLLNEALQEQENKLIEERRLRDEEEKAKLAAKQQKDEDFKTLEEQMHLALVSQISIEDQLLIFKDQGHAEQADRIQLRINKGREILGLEPRKKVEKHIPTQEELRRVEQTKELNQYRKDQVAKKIRKEALKLAGMKKDVDNVVEEKHVIDKQVKQKKLIVESDYDYLSGLKKEETPPEIEATVPKEENNLISVEKITPESNAAEDALNIVKDLKEHSPNDNDLNSDQETVEESIKEEGLSSEQVVLTKEEKNELVIANKPSDKQVHKSPSQQILEAAAQSKMIAIRPIKIEDHLEKKQDAKVQGKIDVKPRILPIQKSQSLWEKILNIFHLVFAHIFSHWPPSLSTRKVKIIRLASKQY